MRLFLSFVFMMLATFSLLAADLAGTWKGTMETQMGETSVAITIQPGAGLTGKVQADQFEAAIEKGKVDGDKISFEINIEHGKVAYEGTVSGDQMKLNVTGTQGTKYVLVCKRQK